MSSPAVLDPPVQRPPSGSPDRLDRPLVAPTPPRPRTPATQPQERAVYRAGEWRGTQWPIVVPKGAADDIELFLDWVSSDEFPAGLKASLIDGKLWLEPRMDDYARHNLLKLAVAAALQNYGVDTDRGQAFVDGAMVVTGPGTLGREPDCGFNLFESFRSGRVRIQPRTEGGSTVVVGAADLLVECLSDGSVEKDTVELRRVYFDLNVREYWILDGRGEEPTFDLLTRTGDATDWTAAEPDADGFRLSPVLGRRVRIDRGTNPLGDVRWSVPLEPPAAE